MLWTNTGCKCCVRGTKQSAQTDLDGKYNVQAKAGDVPLFLCRMIDKTVVVGASSTVNVILKRKLNFLDEVVVVAFGKQTAKSIVGSVVTIGKSIGEATSDKCFDFPTGTVAGLILSLQVVSRVKTLHSYSWCFFH
jgi:hypothetical protein